MQKSVSATEAIGKLKAGNSAYLNCVTPKGDISPKIRKETYENGQKPYAAVVGCADSRVIPESIFSAGIGELFTIRCAGNVIGNHVLGSIEYAVHHLGCKLVLVLGHTGCGAVAAANQKNGGFVKFITDEISSAIGLEGDPKKASILNINSSVKRVESVLANCEGVKVCGALYNTDSGIVDFEI